MSVPEAKKILPFGRWPSPITPAMVGRRVRLDDVQWDSDGQTLVYLEGRGGRSTLMAYSEGEAPRELTPDNNVSGGAGYGGGEFTLSGGQIVFADRNGRLFQRSLQQGLPHPITPPFGAAASPVLSPDGCWTAYVFSDGETDLIAVVDTAGHDWPRKLVRGADFYMQPVWHPGGKYFAWVEWDQPNMPWDGTRLMLAGIEGNPPQIKAAQQIAGGADVPVCQPEFSPDGRWISYITRSGEWENLVVRDLESGTERMLVRGEGFMLSTPAWVQGRRFYGWSADSRSIFYTCSQNGAFSLHRAGLESGVSAAIPVDPYTSLSQLSVSPLSDELAFIASCPSIPTRIVRWNGVKLQTLARSDSESVNFDFFPSARPIQWLAPDGTPVHGIYYPPTHPDFEGCGLPPAIVFIHGGPTAQSNVDFSFERAYFTSRGYAYLEVNYRGSTGYGWSYQQAQRGLWGEVDVEDAKGAAQALIDQKLADPAKLVIRGGSAGGYTVLNTLIHAPGLYKAGICLYGVSNLFTISMAPFKFEARYNDILLGTLPEAAARYHDWSPVFHADRIRDPLAIFQGDHDQVVPLSQSEEVVRALRQYGVPHIYQVYEGEGHGFRKPETLMDYLQKVEQFLLEYVIFAA